MDTSRRGQPRWWLVVPALALVAAGGVWSAVQQPAERAPGEPAAAGRAAVVAGRDLPEAHPAARQPGDPLRVEIPALGVDARVRPILAPGGVLTPPADPRQLGWWADGARPGDRLGSALVTGHTVSTGGGALDDLEELQRGDGIQVRSRSTRTTYVVRSVRTLSKGALAARAEQLFDQDVANRLVVVTCEDWDGEEYLSNVVVTAAPRTAP